MSTSDYDFWYERASWSQETFGTVNERGPLGPLRHLKKELLEEVLPLLDEATGRCREGRAAELVEELVDLRFLVDDAMMRQGVPYGYYQELLWAKLKRNRGRVWPKSTSPNEPVEHDRSQGGEEPCS